VQTKVILLMCLLSFLGSFACGGVTQKKHQQRQKGEAAKQRASEQPVFTNLSLERGCMKMWCFLNRDSPNKWLKYDRCGVAFPWPMSQKYFWGNSCFPSYIDTTLTV